MNLDHESQQLGVPIMSPNSWEFRSHIREPNQVWNQILYLLAKSQDLGMSYQKGLGSMHFSPNSLKARFFFISVKSEKKQRLAFSLDISKQD